MNSIFWIWQPDFGAQQFRSLQSKPTHSHTNTHLYQCTTHISAVAVSGPAFASCPFQPPPAVVFTGDHDPNDVATRSSLALLGGDVIATLAKWPRRFVVRLGLVVVITVHWPSWFAQTTLTTTTTTPHRTWPFQVNSERLQYPRVSLSKDAEVHKKHLPFLDIRHQINILGSCNAETSVRGTTRPRCVAWCRFVMMSGLLPHWCDHAESCFNTWGSTAPLITGTRLFEGLLIDTEDHNKSKHKFAWLPGLLKVENKGPSVKSSP